MNNHDYTKHLANAARLAVALCALAALDGRAAQAQATIVTSPSQLINPVQTARFPAGNVNNTPGQVAPSFTVATMDGANNVTFTSSTSVNGVGFESAIANANDGPQFTAGDEIENTFVAPSQNTGPVRIDFQFGVAGFGLFAQDANADTETFTVTVFNGTTQLGTFSSLPTPNGDVVTDPNDPRGNAVFIGAQSNTGPLITSAILSSMSFANGTGGNPTNGSNDFFFGPTQVQNAPVPEASTVVSFGMGMLLFTGLALVARKRKVNGTA